MAGAVDVVDDGRTHLRPIHIGRRNGEHPGRPPASVGGRLVTYPSNNVVDQVKVKGRT